MYSSKQINNIRNKYVNKLKTIDVFILALSDTMDGALITAHVKDLLTEYKLEMKMNILLYSININ